MMIMRFSWQKLWVIFVFYGINLLLPTQALSWMSLGFAGVEEGDDRYRPALVMQVDQGQDQLLYRLYHYGRQWGPVLERTFIVSVSQPVNIFRKTEAAQWTGTIGFTAMDEYISIDIPNDEAHKRQEHNFNFGLNAGLKLNIWQGQSSRVQLNWESHIFVAGLAGIFLSTGRKSAVSLQVGVAL